MNNKEDIVHSTRVTGLSKGVIVFTCILFLIISAFILFFVIMLMLNGEVGIGVLLFVIVLLPLWFWIVSSWRIGSYTTKRSSYTIKLTSDGIYEHKEYIDEKREEERIVYYDQIQVIFVGRDTEYIQGSLGHYVRIRIYWVWEKDNEKYINSVLVDNRETLNEVLSRFPENIPIRAYEYDSFIPLEAIDELLIESKLIERVNGQHITLPFPAFEMVALRPSAWEPADTRKHRRKKHRKLNRIADVLFLLCMIYIVYSVVAWMSRWPIKDDELVSDYSLLVPIPYFLIFVICYSFRKGLPIKRLAVKSAFILLAYFIGGVSAISFLNRSDDFLGAVMVEGMVSLVYLLITIAGFKIIWMFISSVPATLSLMKLSKDQEKFRLKGGAE